MTRTIRLLLVGMIALTMAVVALPRGASAHPMGNFSINQYSALTIGNDHVLIRYVLDMAEIPTFQELGLVRSDHSTDLTPAEHQTYVTNKTNEIMSGLSLTINGSAVPLQIVDTSLSFPPGNGGLPTTRFEMHLSATLNGLVKGSLAYNDTNFAGRIGYREVIAVPATGTMFQQTDVPQTDQTNGLTLYTPSAVSAPLDKTSANLTFAPGAASASAAPSGQTVPSNEGAVDWAKQRIDDVASLISEDNLPFGALLLGLLVAFLWGAGHAMSPGHGKSVVAAYLVGTRGTARHAVILGITVTVSHTVGVFLLGLVVLFAANFIVPDVLYPIIGVMSGLFIVAMGVMMFVQRFIAWRKARTIAYYGIDQTGSSADAHSHSNETDYDPSTPHSHGAFSKPHTHATPEGATLSMRSLLTLGITGGIIPCPTALVVLLAAIAYHRVALGLAWILSFSLGLAAVLVVLGLMVVYGKGFLSRFDRSRFSFGTKIMARLPMASALMVAILGILIAFQALQVQLR